MSHAPAHRARAAAALCALIALAALAGCYNPFSPRIAPALGFSQPAPIPNSASNLLRLFEWCYNNKAIAEYRELFTDDYRFFFNPVDSAGAEYRGTPFTREDELIYATQLFVGGSADRPPASSIRLTLDKNFFVYPDPTYVTSDPKGRWHKNIRTQVFLNIRTDDGNSIEISGAANFYLVRGDFAVIPEELLLRGFGPDSTRWYIRRWDDETVVSQSGDLAARPVDGPARIVPATTGARPASPAALGDGPLSASWGYAKVYFIRR